MPRLIGQQQARGFDTTCRNDCDLRADRGYLGAVNMACVQPGTPRLIIIGQPDDFGRQQHVQHPRCVKHGLLQTGQGRLAANHFARIQIKERLVLRFHKRAAKCVTPQKPSRRIPIRRKAIRGHGPVAMRQFWPDKWHDPPAP